MQDEILLGILQSLRKIVSLLSDILKQLKRPHHWIEGFLISKQGGFNVALVPVAPGFSPVYTATPIPAGAFPAPGNVPTWTSSDTTNAPVTADSTGLIGTVAIPTTATVGAGFVLTVSYTNADGTVATGSLSQTIVAAPSPDITGFTITQTA